MLLKQSLSFNIRKVNKISYKISPLRSSLLFKSSPAISKILSLHSYSTHHTNLTQSPSPSSPQSPPSSPIKKNYRYYYDQFKQKPGHYLFTFLLLHELTAILPIIIIYLLFQMNNINAKDFLFYFNQELILSVEKKALYVLKKYLGMNFDNQMIEGINNDIDQTYDKDNNKDDNKSINTKDDSSITPITTSTTTNLASFYNLLFAYTLVKFLAPLRLVLSATLTPYCSKKMIEPSFNRMRKLLKK